MNARTTRQPHAKNKSGFLPHTKTKEKQNINKIKKRITKEKQDINKNNFVYVGTDISFTKACLKIRE